MPEKLQTFGTRVKRSFDDDPYQLNAPTYVKTPGPGQYKSHHSMSASTTGKNYSGFNSTQKRFSMGNRKGAPGPGSYQNNKTESMYYHVQNKKFGIYGVFGSTSSRFNRRPSTMPSSVGPGSYTPKEIPSEHIVFRDRGGTSSFKSAVKRDKTGRVRKHGTPKVQSPAPGQYEIKGTFGTNKKYGNFLPSQAFINKSERFSNKTYQKPIPGPGSYNSGKGNTISGRIKATKPNKSGFASDIPRFGPEMKKSKLHVPGPGMYTTTSYDIDSAINPFLKQTFNVAIFDQSLSAKGAV